MTLTCLVMLEAVKQYIVTPYWKDFVENSTKEDFLEKSEENKARAEGVEARYKKACLGYARLREMLVATQEELAEHELTGTNDLFAQLIPKEYSGRVRAAGWGVTKKSLQKISTMSELSQLKNDVAYLINEIKELKSKGCNPSMQSRGSSQMDNFDMDKEFIYEHNDDHDPVIGEELPETHQKDMNKERVQHAKEHKKMDDKENNKLAHKVKEKTRESVVGVSSRKLGYPLPGDICDDAVLDFVRLAVKFNRVTDVVVHMGNYWERDAWNDYINKENVLEVLDNQWLSATSLTFYIRYLCEVYLSNNPDLAAKFSFISPHIVSHMVDSSNTSLANCLLKYVDKDHLLFVPWNVSHWILVAINAKTEYIYFMDPAPMTNNAYYKNVKAFIETAMIKFRTNGGKKYTMTSFNSFKWMNVQCPKQRDGISCGYYVGCFIEDILGTGETKINVNISKHQSPSQSPVHSNFPSVCLSTSVLSTFVKQLKHQEKHQEKYRDKRLYTEARQTNSLKRLMEHDEERWKKFKEDQWKRLRDIEEQRPEDDGFGNFSLETQD
ncbi:hypothetical protein DCAR_0205262 [Daucus carota subsp. sativus]|uniref:Ubiquitin-like protease family profile domain-containing protein n=1 Tax=Daucus carota subsp. sativus TaxID=79200 RepID=A0AAF0WDJ9_DAUCS|nr:hypothetical protein DCAR_0205262 [Daucus carota subsp. sativus]